MTKLDGFCKLSECKLLAIFHSFFIGLIVYFTLKRFVCIYVEIIDDLFKFSSVFQDNKFATLADTSRFLSF